MIRINLIQESQKGGGRTRNRFAPSSKAPATIGQNILMIIGVVVLLGCSDRRLALGTACRARSAPVFVSEIVRRRSRKRERLEGDHSRRVTDYKKKKDLLQRKIAR